MARLIRSLKERLVNILTENKILTPDELNKALEVLRQKGGRLPKKLTKP